MNTDVPSTLASIRADLLPHVDLAFRDGAVNFFKEPVNPLGVRSAQVRACANRHWPRIKAWDRDRLLDLAEALWASGVFEDGVVASHLLERAAKGSRPEDFDRFEAWLTAYVTNWAHCDVFCTHAFGQLLLRFPDLRPRILDWPDSPNRWARRASAVILIPLVKAGQGLDLALNTADRLLADPDDLVQKGYGWLLKVASHRFQQEVLAFVLARRATMPRTALRYALEKMPLDLRQEAMRRTDSRG